MKYKIQFDLICPESDNEGDLIDPDNLEEEARATYGGQENLSLREMEEKLLKTLAGGKANQFKRNFGILYNMHSGNAHSIFDEKETEDYLNKAFNIDSKPPVKTISTLNIDKEPEVEFDICTQLGSNNIPSISRFPESRIVKSVEGVPSTEPLNTIFTSSSPLSISVYKYSKEPIS